MSPSRSSALTGPPGNLSCTYLLSEDPEVPCARRAVVRYGKYRLCIHHDTTAAQREAFKQGLMRKEIKE